MEEINTLRKFLFREIFFDSVSTPLFEDEKDLAVFILSKNESKEPPKKNEIAQKIADINFFIDFSKNRNLKKNKRLESEIILAVEQKYRIYCCSKICKPCIALQCVLSSLSKILKGHTSAII